MPATCSGPRSYGEPVAEVSVAPAGVVIEPSNWERAGGLVGRFVVGFERIADVSTSAAPLDLVEGWRMGVGLPRTRIGTWRHDGVKDYLCIRDGRPALVLTCTPEADYARVIVTVPDPDALAEQVRAALSPRKQ